MTINSVLELCASVAVASSKRSRESPSVSGTLKRLPQAQRERYNPEDLSHSRVKNARRVLNTDAVYSSPAASALETALNFSDSSVDEVDMMLLFENEFSNDYKGIIRAMSLA